MGLDIIAYSKLQYIDPQPITEDEQAEAHETLGAQKFYESDYQRLFPQAEGFYSIQGDRLRINCGAYSRYNRWRENLARLAGWPLGKYEAYGKDWPSHAATAWEAESGPFWELINFSDCEGCIGAVNSAKLLKDFTEQREGIAQRALLFPEGEYFMGKYDEWMEAFRLASDGGAVRFC